MKKIILFYSSVKRIDLFYTQKFYSIDLNLLEDLGYEVILTNKIHDFLIRRYDIAFIYFYKWGFFSGLFARLRRKRVFYTGGIDDLDLNYASRKRYFMQLIFFKLCRFVSNFCLIVSMADLYNIKKIYDNRVPNKLLLVYHAIDFNAFIPDSKNKNPDFVTVAWMESIENVRRKGIDLAIYYFNDLISKQEFSKSIMYIIGKQGSGSEYLKKIIEELHLEDRVDFVGVVDEKQKVIYLKKSAYYFQLSLYEGFGLAALEALAAKCIVIHSGRGGLKELVGNSGVLVDISFKNNTSKLYTDILAINSDAIDSYRDYLEQNYNLYKRRELLGNIINGNYN